MSEHEKSPDQQLLDELTERVGKSVTSARIQQLVLRQLAELLGGVEKDVKQTALESLLLYRGRIVEKRDREWARIMAAIWLQTPGAELPTSNPHELQAWILAKQQDRERGKEQLKYRAGLRDGFQEGLTAGVKHGFGSSEIGSTLDAALASAGKLKPSL